MTTKSFPIGIGSRLMIKYLPMNKADFEDYTSKIIDIENEQIIHVLIPSVEGNIKLIPLGDSIDITAFRNDATGGMVSFTGEVVSRVQGNVPYLKIKITSEIKKIQRREFFRLPVITKSMIRKVPQNINSDLNYMPGITKDISGGGVSISTNLSLEKSDLLDVKVFIDNSEDNFIHAQGRILRVSPTSGSAYKFEIGVRFESITDASREKLIQYIFIEQRKLRQKGMI